MFDSELEKEQAIDEVENELEQIEESINTSMDAKQDAEACVARAGRDITKWQRQRTRREKYLAMLRKTEVQIPTVTEE
jgi:septal ring factor EnvC (AmiA/AmiB activator)